MKPRIHFILMLMAVAPVFFFSVPSTVFADTVYDFHRAVINDDVDKVRSFLKQGMDVNVQGSKGRTALMYACWYFKPNAGHLLLEAGADPSIQDDDGYNAIDYAASIGDLGGVEILLGNSKLPDNRNYLNYAKLMYDAYTDNKDDYFKGSGKVEYINRENPQGTTPLSVAASKGGMNAIKKFIGLGADINLRPENGYTAIELAAWNNKTDVIGYLLEEGASINGQPGRTSPLILAIQNKSVEAVKLLIEKGADIEFKDNHGLSAKMLALECGNQEIKKAIEAKDPTPYNKDEVNNTLIDILGAFGSVDMIKVRALLDNGADPNAQDAQGNTSLHKAVEAVSPEAVRLLLDHGADPNARNKQGRTPLMSVGYYRNPEEPERLEVAKLLVEKGADVNAVADHDTDVLSSLVPYDVPKVMEYLIQNGAKVDRQDKEGRTALYQAVEYNNTAVVKVLLQQGADPFLNRKSPMDAAIIRHDHDIVEAMMEFVKPGSANPGLITAAQEGDKDIVEEFLAKKVDINIQNEAGMTALMAAVDKGHPDIVKILLDAGAGTDSVDKSGYGTMNGETALCMASRKNMPEVVEDLLKHKADMDASCNAVEGAARAGSAQIVQLFADAGADMHDRFTGHWHALFAAAESGNTDIAKIMLDHGTPVDMRDDMDSTALMVASGKGNLDVIRLLVRHKAGLEAVNSKRPMSDVGSNLIGTPLMWAMETHQQKAIELLLSLGAKPKDYKPNANSYVGID